jgi:hypothetical protein
LISKWVNLYRYIELGKPGAKGKGKGGKKNTKNNTAEEGEARAAAKGGGCPFLKKRRKAVADLAEAGLCTSSIQL